MPKCCVPNLRVLNPLLSLVCVDFKLSGPFVFVVYSGFIQSCCTLRITLAARNQSTLVTRVGGGATDDELGEALTALEGAAAIMSVRHANKLIS